MYGNKNGARQGELAIRKGLHERHTNVFDPGCLVAVSGRGNTGAQISLE